MARTRCVVAFMRFSLMHFMVVGFEAALLFLKEDKTRKQRGSIPPPHSFQSWSHLVRYDQSLPVNQHVSRYISFHSCYTEL